MAKGQLSLILGKVKPSEPSMAHSLISDHNFGLGLAMVVVEDHWT